MQIATNAGHTAQNDSRTVQNDGCNTLNTHLTHNTLIFRSLGTKKIESDN